MAIAVRPADLCADRKLIISFLSNYLTSLSNAERFEWLYLNNPHGHARVWIATQDGSGLPIGIAGAFPRRVRVGTGKKLAWILGDFCIHDQHRSLGPALLLQRACLAAVDAGGADFCYDLPSANMMAVYRRLHISPATQMLRLARPLRIDRKVRTFVKMPQLARAISVVGNFFIGLSSRGFEKQNVALHLHIGRCGEEFSALADSMRDQIGFCIERSAEYLNWRYLDNPLKRYEFLTARCGEGLAGCAVFCCDGEDATLVDLFAVDDEIIAMLIRATTYVVRTRGVTTLSAPMGESHPLLPLMHRHGFRTRETSPVIAYGAISEWSDDTKRVPSWRLMHGDGDS